MRSWSERVSRVVVAGSFALLAGSVGVGTAHADAVPQVTICHLPPGNPTNVQLITVGAPAVAAHVANHGDAVCADGASDCCANETGEVCTNLQDDPNNCGTCGTTCGHRETCSAGECVRASRCPLVEGLGCYWMDCFSVPGECCWNLNGFFADTAARCAELDSCNPGGGGLSNGGCYKWATSSETVIFPPWP